MDVSLRPATPADGQRIREIARQSFETSYALSPAQIETLVEEEFGDDPLVERMDREDALVLVAEAGDETAPIRGFALVDFVEAGAIRWLHVEPGARGQGVGTRLVERATAALADRDLPLSGRALERDTEGGTFCEYQFGLVEDGREPLAVGGEEFFEYVYVENGEGSDPNEPSVEVPETVSANGEELSVDREDETAGTQAPFFGVYRPDDERWGYVCSNCASTDVAAADLDRLACGNCGNEHRPDDWDPAYL